MTTNNANPYYQNIQSEPPELMNVSELSEYLCIGKNRAYELLRQKK